MSKYKLVILIASILFLSNGASFAQCPQFFDFQGVLQNNPEWVSCSGGDFTLNIISDVNIGNYSIDWGDGTPITNGTGLIANTAVTHNYLAAIANYNVIISLPDIPCTVNGLVIMEEPSNASIQIPFGGLTTVCAPGSLEFTNSSTDVSPNTIFTWDFGDGSPIQTFPSTNLGQTLSHLYLQGTVNCVTQVTLTAENVCNTLQGGASVATFNPIRIYDIDDAAIAPSANLLCYPDTIVTLQNTTNRNCLAQGNIAQRFEKWNLGDYFGQGVDSIIDWRPWPPTLPLTIAYPGIGTYTAMLIDSSFCGLDTAFVTINIVAPPMAGLTISDDTICEGETVTINNLSTGGVDYSINFGDGSGWNAAGGGTTAHTYTVNGDYIVQIAAFVAGAAAACADTAEVPLHVLASPVANFNFDNNNGCDTLTVNFSNLSSGDAITWDWDFGNGNMSNLQNPLGQFYNAPGNYNVQLDVSNVNGCVNSITQVINVFQSPIPAFFPTSVCVNEVAAFTDSSTSAVGDPILTWDWNFGDGTTSNVQDPNHVYTTPGIVDIILDISTAFCSNLDTIQLTVENAPTAGFNPDLMSGCSPLTINFPNTSSANAASFSWNFGDGTTSTLTNPDHIFINNSGADTIYNVMLIAQTLFGCVDTIVQQITVFPNPIASFNDDAILDCAPLIVSFTNTTIGATAYAWDFGDGSPIDNSVSPSHVYQNLTQFINNHMVTLIATSLNGCTDTITDSLLVFPEPQFGFSTNPDSGCSPLNVIFPSVIGAVLYQWDFGDGGTATGPTPNHTYVNSTTNNVIYPIQLIATSPFGCIDTTSGEVLVFPNPTAQFSTNLISGCHPLPVNFTNNSTGGSIFHWDFGDGTAFDTLVSNLDHTFFNITGVQQTYEVSLIAETTDGCMDTAYQDIDVYPDVTALFVSDTAGCSPFDVDFIDASFGAVNYVWDFGDGSPIDTNQNPSHQYINTTPIDINFTVTLIIESAFGCLDTIQRILTVYATPVASFTATPGVQTFPNATVAYTNTSSPGVWQYAWDFGDSTFSNQQAPNNHIYSTWGIYPITLIVNNINCSDTAIQSIEIIPPIPIASFEGPAEGCRPLDVQFVNNSIYGETYLWDFGDGGTSTQFAPSYTYFNPGVYTVSLTVFGPGGQDIETMIDSIRVYNVPNAFFTVAPTIVFLPNQAASFFNLSTIQGGGPLSWNWDFGDGNFSTDQSPQHFYLEQGVYDIQLIVTTPNNCADTFDLPAGVEAKSQGNIQIPNAFSPSPGGSNGGLFSSSDTDNDVFHPLIVGAEQYELNIFNKWGELLFISKDVNIGWDGYYRGELSKQDVYVYKISVKFIDGTSDSFVGDVTLLR